MPAIDFKEIPSATSGAQRDQFELFARECLHSMGFIIVTGPDRGPDAGRDLVVEEIRTGIAGETRVKWLVSCKHNAHSGASIKPENEQNIHDRVRTHGCKGFLAFYSTIPSSGLATTLNATNREFEVQILDPEKIERHLLSTSARIQLAQRFFPKSIAGWKAEHPSPARIFTEEPELSCAYCGKSLLVPEPRGIVVVWTTLRKEREPTRIHTEHVCWCCNGACDQALRTRYRRNGLSDAWEDIRDLIIPVVYIRWIMVMLNDLHGGMTYSNEALASSKQLLLNLFPLVSRNMTDEEKKRVKLLTMIPSYLGGLGYDG